MCNIIDSKLRCEFSKATLGVKEVFSRLKLHTMHGERYIAATNKLIKIFLPKVYFSSVF